MSNYNKEYADYYSGLRSSKVIKGAERKNEFNRIGGRKIKKERAWGNIIATQIIGSLLLLLLMIGIKIIGPEKTDNFYMMAKENIMVNYDIYELKDQAIATFNSIKNNINNEINATNLKEENAIPLLGSVYKNDEGGVFIENEKGNDVFSINDGEVKEILKEDGITTIIIDHSSGLESYYTFIETSVKKGDKITKGECIGKSGEDKKNKKQGIALKIKYMGKDRNPMDFIDFSA